MKERDELRRERALNRAKRSASLSSTVSALPTTKRNIGFSYGLAPDEVPNEGEDTVIKYHNWNEFQEKLDDLEEEKARLRQEAREARTDGLPTVKNPYATYPAESMKNLAYIVGLKNRGISYNPELNAANTAQLYIAKHKMQAPTIREKAAWDKWGVSSIARRNHLKMLPYPYFSSKSRSQPPNFHNHPNPKKHLKLSLKTTPKIFYLFDFSQ
jgi:hypothetical protein